jgi:phage/plasmid-like protein (TIGR03299 family)
MAHKIEIENGIAKMFYAGKTPWHKLGTQVEREITAEAAIKLAGMDTENELQPIYIASAKTVDGIPVVGKKVDDKVAVVRKQDNAILGVVGTSYHIIQNRDCFSFMDGIIGEGAAVYHTAGSLFGGKKIFLTVKLPTSMCIGDDKVDKFILMSSSHDGSLAVHLRWTPIRVVCANTLTAAINSCQFAYMVRHRPGYMAKLEDARKALGLCDYYYQQLEICFKKLLDTKMSDNEMEVFAAELFASDENKKPSGNTVNKRNKLKSLFKTLPDLKHVKNTRWAGYNAVTHFIDHERSTRLMNGRNEDEVRFASTVFGGGSGLRQKAFELLTGRITA